jgi:DNA polymerase
MTSWPNPDSRELFIDIETYSSVDIRAAGLYPYVESDDFEVMLIAYAWGDDPVRLLDFSEIDFEEFDPEERDPDLWRVLCSLQNPNDLKIAHNNAFERTALRKQFTRYGRDFYLPPEEWHDTMILAAMNGLPMSLDAAGAALNIEQQKLKEGTALINYFCKPCKPTIANGGRTRNYPEHAPDKWQRFKEYCGRDVEAMRLIYRRLQRFPVPDWERRVWCLDARINERGVLIDRDLAEAAIQVDEAFKEEHTTEMQKLTGLENPNSVAQLKTWLEGVGVSCESLNKATVADLKKALPDPTTRRVLELRQLLGKTSTKKYQAMTSAAGKDDRVRGILQYYGAGRTGRWAGRLVQVQNLPQNHLDDIGTVRELVRSRDLEALELCFDNVPDVLSQLIRTAFVAKPGHTFLVSDYAAIEARVIAYLAGEKWRQEVFAKGGDIYCSSASQMFKVPVEKHGINGHLRQKGKVAELACGYGGGVGALKAFGADKMGLTETEMQDIVDQWRAASPTIPKFWRDTERAAKRALENPGTTQTIPCGVKYRRDADALRCRLPSGRILTYWGARLDNDGSICFMGQNQTTRKWEKTETWGGKLVENIVQAYARDCLAVALLRLDEAGYDITFHVHDEIIAEAPEGSRWEDMAEIMGRPISWAPGLILRGDGYDTKFYMKD